MATSTAHLEQVGTTFARVWEQRNLDVIGVVSVVSQPDLCPRITDTYVEHLERVYCIVGTV